MRCLEFVQGKTLSRGFFDEYSFKQLRRKTRGQWQKCYGEASMSIYYYYYRGMVIFHEAVGRVEYPFQGSNKSRYSIGESVCNNNFIIIINKNTGIVSLIIL